MPMEMWPVIWLALNTVTLGTADLPAYTADEAESDTEF